MVYDDNNAIMFSMDYWNNHVLQLINQRSGYTFDYNLSSCRGIKELLMIAV